MSLDQDNKGTVLVVDDNAANLGVLFDSLRQAGFRVLIAEDGASALKRIDHTLPDIILLDVRMPDTDGFELYGRMKATNRLADTPVIFLSVVSDAAEKVRALALNAVDYVTKPFDPVEVVARVDKHLTLRNLRKSLQEKNARLEQEIIERERIETQLQAALAEKEVLLKEVYHRVKNNMAALSSLIYIHAQTSETAETAQIFNDLQGRVRAMTLVHQKLYQSADLARIDFGEYLRELIQNLIDAMWTGRSLLWHVEANNVFVNLNLAIPCSLIANELITNVFKHAFPKDQNENQLDIVFALDGEMYTLMVSDNGVGLPPEWDKSQSLGLKLINILTTHQLKGSLELDQQVGTTFTVRFPA